MTRTEKENLVPVWERITISLEEAERYRREKAVGYDR